MPNLALHHGPFRAPGIRVGDREPITDGGRVMWGLERTVDYNSSPVTEWIPGGIGRAKCAPSRADVG
jgi:hypothetical protein